MGIVVRRIVSVGLLATLVLMGMGRGRFANAESATAYIVGVEGMSWPHSCAPRVKESLQGIDGVESVAVDFDAKQATIRMAPGKALSREACDQAFGNSGYFVSSFAEHAAQPGG